MNVTLPTATPLLMVYAKENSDNPGKRCNGRTHILHITVLDYSIICCPAVNLQNGAAYFFVLHIGRLLAERHKESSINN